MANVQVTVKRGDITEIPADMLITAINSDGAWFGGIDDAIQRVAGPMFHNQAAAVRLRDGDTVLAKANGSHGGAFRDVVFVVDDLRRPLSQIVEASLKAADEAGATSVTLPALRTGVMAGEYESPLQAIAQAGIGVRKFVGARPAHIRRITFVIYNDPASERALRSTLA